ncbi:MAG: FliA/WhiG family RNA polymerase sigma factor [Clostridia bacterium]|nr:MAG: FliA/WhiG family RNA polymerase sigma factor [Clostridia bacterium]
MSRPLSPSSNPDLAAREELILKNLPLVRYIAGRMGTRLPPVMDFEDLVAAGVLGLIEAVDRYDWRRGVKFETFASTRIRGAMLDALRAAGWAPRSLVQRLRQVAAAQARLEQGQGGMVTDAQLASALGISADELNRVYEQAHQVSLVSLEEFLADDVHRLGENVADPESPDPVTILEEQELRRSLARALASMEEQDRLVLTLYYFEKLTLKEIGQILGVSESRVCQLRGRAVIRLRAAMASRGWA